MSLTVIDIQHISLCDLCKAAADFLLPAPSGLNYCCGRSLGSAKAGDFGPWTAVGFTYCEAVWVHMAMSQNPVPGWYPKLVYGCVFPQNMVIL